MQAPGSEDTAIYRGAEIGRTPVVSVMAAGGEATGGRDVPSWVALLNSPFVSMGLMFGSMQAMRVLDATDRRTVLALRGLYVLSQIAQALVWLHIRSAAARAASGKKSDDAQATVVVEEPAAPFSGEPPRRSTMSVGAYDAGECAKALQQLAIGVVIMFVLHFWLGMVQPLLMQMLTPWKTIATHPLVLIHVFGCAPSGTLARPFKQPSAFDMFTQASSETGAADEAAGAVEGAAEGSDAASAETDSPAGESSPVLVARRKVKSPAGRRED